MQLNPTITDVKAKGKNGCWRINKINLLKVISASANTEIERKLLEGTKVSGGGEVSQMFVCYVYITNLHVLSMSSMFVIFFLDASTHLYNRLCPLVGWLVDRVTHSLKTLNSCIFSTEMWSWPSKRSIHLLIHSINYWFIHK